VNLPTIYNYILTIKTHTIIATICIYIKQYGIICIFC